MAEPTAGLPPRLESRDDALKWVEKLVEDVERARFGCDVMIPGEGSLTVRDQKRAERVYLIHHGSALGALGALLRCDMISPVAYNQFVERVRATLIPSNVGRVS